MGDPKFAMDDDALSTWTAVAAGVLTYEQTGMTYSILTDGAANFTTDTLFGHFVNPNLAQDNQLLITSNTMTQLLVAGDASDLGVTTGAQYLIIDYHLLK